MTRADLQQLADVRLNEAGTLLKAGHFNGAYYLAGYSIECALKACIAKQFKQEDIPDKSFVLKIYQHKLPDLLDLAGVKPWLGQASSSLQGNWSIVKDWSEQSRYEILRTRSETETLFNAIADPKDGVLLWLKTFW